jgi:ribose transport system substrate-binding protein
MHPDKADVRARRLLSLLLVAGVIASGLLLAACGSSGSSSSSESTSAEPTESTEAAETTESETAEGGDPETTVYAEGVPTLKELYESSNEEPPTTGPAAAEGKSVAFISCSQASPGCSGGAAAFTEAGKVLGWTVRTYDGKFNESNGYATAFHAAIASGADAIVETGISCEETKTLLEEAKSAKIPVIESSSPDCPGADMYVGDSYYNKNAKGASEYYEQYGENQMAFAIDKTEGKGKFILLEWPQGIGQYIYIGYQNMLEKCSECEVLESIKFEAGELGPGLPLEQHFKTALTKYPEADAALFTFDSLATFGGLAKVAVDSGNDELMMIGAEGSAEAIALMEEEKGVSAEAGATDVNWTGWVWADQLNRYFNGQPSVPQGVGLSVVTTEKNLPPKGKPYQTEVDYKKAYEAIWAGEKE